MATEGKRSGRIPAFGEWDKADELPITQYFESARQAGLIRFSGEYKTAARNGGAAVEDLYGVRGFHQAPPHRAAATTRPPRKVKCSKGCPQYAKGPRRLVCTEPVKNRSGSHKQLQEQTSIKSTRDIIVTHQQQQRPKPVDGDLYKIPPELLHNRNRKKVFGFFSRCLAPPCIA